MPESYTNTVRKIVKDHKSDPGDLIGVLQDIQTEYRYLPREALDEVSKTLKVPLNRVFAVSTFFRAFYITPRGKHDCVVCTGTACHVRGAPRIVDELMRMLKTDVRGTSPDGNFTLDTVNCLGQCAMGPVITIDGTLHPKVSVKELKRIFKTSKTEEKRTDETPKRSGPGKKKSVGKRAKRSK